MDKKFTFKAGCKQYCRRNQIYQIKRILMEKQSQKEKEKLKSHIS